MNSNFNYQRKIFENVYSDFEDISNQASVKIIHEIIRQEKRPIKILDLGCGDGKLMGTFANYHSVYGIDGSKHLLKIAKKRGLKTIFSDLESRLPLGDNFFDLVIVHHVLEHIVDTDSFLIECNRILKKNSRLIIGVPNVSNPLSFIMLLADLPPNMGARYRSAHVRDFTAKILKLALVNNGFFVEKILGASNFFPPQHRLTFLTRRFPRIARDIVVISRKLKKIDKNVSKYSFFVNKLKD